jgi:hypothetical protein
MKYIPILLLLTSCANVDVHQLRMDETKIDMGKVVLVLGRHHSPEYETEPALVKCIAKHLSKRGIGVVDPAEFKDYMFPWFEPRTAPLNPTRFDTILKEPMVHEYMATKDIEYIVWIEGDTKKTAGGGSISCSIGTGGAGCYGFGHWEDTSEYEATIWNFDTNKEAGKIALDAQGQSYIVGVGVPVPLLARVQAKACKGFGNQIANFFEVQPSN